MSRTSKALVELIEGPGLSAADCKEFLKEGVADLLSSTWDDLSRCDDAGDMKATYINIIKVYGTLFGENNPIVESVRTGLESATFTEDAIALINSGWMVKDHPASVIPVMYEDENNVNNFLSLLTSIAELGIREGISIDEDGLILNGQQRFRCSVIACRLSFPTHVESAWTVKDKWATLAGRNLSPSQKVALAHSMHYRADYRGSAEAAAAIGVSRSLVDKFDVARREVTESNVLDVAGMLAEVIHGRWTVQDYARAAKAHKEAKAIQSACNANDVDVNAVASVDIDMCSDPTNYFDDFDAILDGLGDDTLNKLAADGFPRRLLPKEEDDLIDAEEESRKYLNDGPTMACLMSQGNIGIAIFGDDAGAIGELVDLFGDTVTGIEMQAETDDTHVTLYRTES